MYDFLFIFMLPATIGLYCVNFPCNLELYSLLVLNLLYFPQHTYRDCFLLLVLKSQGSSFPPGQGKQYSTCSAILSSVELVNAPRIYFMTLSTESEWYADSYGGKKIHTNYLFYKTLFCLLVYPEKGDKSNHNSISNNTCLRMQKSQHTSCSAADKTWARNWI